MNLQPVLPARGEFLLCADPEHDHQNLVKTSRWWRDDKVFVDLDGEPFKAFHCAACALKHLSPTDPLRERAIRALGR